MQIKQRRFGNRQLGQGMTEYIIITALIAIAAIAVFTFFGGTVRSQVGGMARELSGETASSSIQKAQAASKKAEAEGKDNKGLGNYQNDNAR
ncbi:pilus assembly protein [Lysobacter sp. F6437]|uniref:pilus assembly protein n=1 Tax=Lysobacter sp. F6437 TaxID=3459296 RepID=UPI00403D5ABA